MKQEDTAIKIGTELADCNRQKFRYTNFVVSTLFIAAYALPLFFLIMYVREHLSFPYVLIFKNLWVSVFVYFIIAMVVYAKLAGKFADRKGTVQMEENGIIFYFAYSTQNIDYKDILKIEFRPYRGSWYALVITTKQRKININEACIYTKFFTQNKVNQESPLYKLYEILKLKQNNNPPLAAVD